jgi:hypothetical protein
MRGMIGGSHRLLAVPDLLMRTGYHVASHGVLPVINGKAVQRVCQVIPVPPPLLQCC